MEGNLMCNRTKDTSAVKYNWKEYYAAHYLKKQEKLVFKSMLIFAAINLILGGIIIWLTS